MKKWMALAVSAILALGLVACGGGNAPSAAASTGGNAPSAAASTGGAATGSKVEAIKAAGKLVMLTNAEFPPFEYLAEGGVAAGVDVELAQKIADELGVELEVVNMDFDGLILALQSGKGDIVAAGMSIDEERKQQVDFSTPYVDTTLYIMVREGDESIASIEDLAGKKVAVQEATTSDLFISDPGNVEVGEVLKFKASAEAASALKGGMADAVVMDDLTAKNVASALGGLTILDTVEVAHEQYAMAVQKGGDDLLAVVNKVLEEAVAQDAVNALISEHMELSKG
ncbi:transporter substrate-binding domain-containing protein [Ruminococcaceae bacterium OttesenSCG-928-A16]|nr:transporter substrate-binding domain-containing protein [Ruminococcaceae bacterium OttesenSCG-928-A16]